MSTLLVLSAVGNLGKKGVIAVIHHTDCGLTHTTDAEIAAALAGSVENAEGVAFDGMKFGSFSE